MKIGLLGKPLGSVVTITGRAVLQCERNDYRSVNMAHNLLAVELVEHDSNPTDIELVMTGHQKSPTDRKASYIGYESGGFAKAPAGATRVDLGIKMVQSNGRHFHTR